MHRESSWKSSSTHRAPEEAAAAEQRQQVPSPGTKRSLLACRQQKDFERSTGMLMCPSSSKLAMCQTHSSSKSLACCVILSARSKSSNSIGQVCIMYVSWTCHSELLKVQCILRRNAKLAYMYTSVLLRQPSGKAGVAG
jgi:hypothetical protein